MTASLKYRLNTDRLQIFGGRLKADGIEGKGSIILTSVLYFWAGVTSWMVHAESGWLSGSISTIVVLRKVVLILNCFLSLEIFCF